MLPVILGSVRLVKDRNSVRFRLFLLRLRLPIVNNTCDPIPGQHDLRRRLRPSANQSDASVRGGLSGILRRSRHVERRGGKSVPVCDR